MSSFCKLVITAIPFASTAQTNIDELLIKTAGTDKVQSLRKARTAIADRLGPVQELFGVNRISSVISIWEVPNRDIVFAPQNFFFTV